MTDRTNNEMIDGVDPITGGPVDNSAGQVDPGELEALEEALGLGADGDDSGDDGDDSGDDGVDNDGGFDGLPAGGVSDAG